MTILSPITPPRELEVCEHCRAPRRPRMSIRFIQEAVAHYYDLPERVMKSASRRSDAAHPRQVAMLLAREFTSASLSGIGERFGERDHSTVSWAVESVALRAAKDPAVAEDMVALRGWLKLCVERALPRPQELVT